MHMVMLVRLHYQTGLPGTLLGQANQRHGGEGVWVELASWQPGGTKWRRKHPNQPTRWPLFAAVCHASESEAGNSSVAASEELDKVFPMPFPCRSHAVPDEVRTFRESEVGRFYRVFHLFVIPRGVISE